MRYISAFIPDCSIFSIHSCGKKITDVPYLNASIAKETGCKLNVFVPEG
jgi:hypothetical protein